MINYISKAEYYTVIDGTEISKKIAKRDYDDIRIYKIIKTDDQSKARGFECKFITITYIHECAPKKQLKLL